MTLLSYGAKGPFEHFGQMGVDGQWCLAARHLFRTLAAATGENFPLGGPRVSAVCVGVLLEKCIDVFTLARASAEAEQGALDGRFRNFGDRVSCPFVTDPEQHLVRKGQSSNAVAHIAFDAEHLILMIEKAMSLLHHVEEAIAMTVIVYVDPDPISIGGLSKNSRDLQPSGLERDRPCDGRSTEDSVQMTLEQHATARAASSTVVSPVAAPEGAGGGGGPRLCFCQLATQPTMQPVAVDGGYMNGTLGSHLRRPRVGGSGLHDDAARRHSAKAGRALNLNTAHLAELLHALRISANFVPFRASKLNTMLSELLAMRGCEVVCLLTLSPVRAHVLQCQPVLAFAGQIARAEPANSAAMPRSNTNRLRLPNAPTALTDDDSADKQDKTTTIESACGKIRCSSPCDKARRLACSFDLQVDALQKLCRTQLRPLTARWRGLLSAEASRLGTCPPESQAAWDTARLLEKSLAGLQMRLGLGCMRKVLDLGDSMDPQTEREDLAATPVVFGADWVSRVLASTMEIRCFLQAFESFETPAEVAREAPHILEATHRIRSLMR